MNWAFAEEPWPKRVADPIFTEVRTATLPKALREALLEFNEFSQGTNVLADSYRICRIDLNDDGKDEFIVQPRISQIRFAN